MSAHPTAYLVARIAAQRQHAARRIPARHRCRRRAAGVLPVPAHHQHVAAAAAMVRRCRGRVDPAPARPAGRGQAGPGAGDHLARLHPHRRPNPERGLGRQADVEPDPAAAGPCRRACRTAPVPACSSAIRDVVGSDPVLMHVYRPDVVSQAVSFWRAVQTRVWRGRPDPEPRRPRRVPRRRHRARHHACCSAPGGGLAQLVRRGEHRAASTCPYPYLWRNLTERGGHRAGSSSAWIRGWHRSRCWNVRPISGPTIGWTAIAPTHTERAADMTPTSACVTVTCDPLAWSTSCACWKPRPCHIIREVVGRIAAPGAAVLRGQGLHRPAAVGGEGFPPITVAVPGAARGHRTQLPVKSSSSGTAAPPASDTS